MRRAILASLLLLLVGVTPAMAQNQVRGASGTWRSDTGNTFRVPYSTRAFDLIITLANGQRTIGQGAWVQYPHRFTYTVSGQTGSCIATFDRRNPNVIRVTGPSGTHYWQRVSY